MCMHYCINKQRSFIFSINNRNKSSRYTSTPSTHMYILCIRCWHRVFCAVFASCLLLIGFCFILRFLLCCRIGKTRVVSLADYIFSYFWWLPRRFSTGALSAHVRTLCTAFLLDGGTKNRTKCQKITNRTRSQRESESEPKTRLSAT